MLVVFDSSALVKLLVQEDGSAVAVRLWDGADAALASRLAVPEVAAALAAAARASRLTDRGYSQALGEWAAYRDALRIVELTAGLAAVAGELAAGLVLGGADAVHLATTLAVGEQVVLAAWDRRLREAASSVGVPVAPTVLG